MGARVQQQVFAVGDDRERAEGVAAVRKAEGGGEYVGVAQRPAGAPSSLLGLPGSLPGVS
jgi:hypothetical protein